MKKQHIIILLIILGLITFLFVKLSSDGFKKIYCISNKCITVWKKSNGEVLIILEKYKSRKIPNDNYIKIHNINSDYIGVILLNDNRWLIDIEDNTIIEKKSSNNLIELYNDNKILNDSLYTYFDGKYINYKDDVNFIIINIKENYAVDKEGKKIR
ncbi:MAG: hypothetical protein ACTTJM_01930 [Bergeyella cardium]